MPKKDQQTFGCPTGQVTPAYSKTLKPQSLYGKKIAPLPKKLLAQAEVVAAEMRVTFEPEAAPHVERGALATLGEALGAVAPVHGEPAITRQAYHVSAGANLPPVNRVVIHTAECDCTPGISTSIGNYFASPNSGGSAQYGVDPTTEGHWVHDNAIAWHAPPNRNSIGVEIAGRASFTAATWASAPVQQALLRAAARTADLVHRYGLPVIWLSPADLLAGKRGITGHVCVSQAWHQSNHVDPGPNFPIKQFLSMVLAFLGQHPTPAPTPTPVPKPAPKPNPTLVKGIQRAVHATADGHWGNQTDLFSSRVRDTHPASGRTAIRALQVQLGLHNDGVWGPITNNAVHNAIVGVQRALGVPADGNWGPRTQSAWAAARKINYGK